MSADHPLQLAILDDYQGVALQMADWSALTGRATITVFRDHVSNAAELVERLQLFNILCVVRERTPLPRAILDQLPRLKLITTASKRNASIDIDAARERGITVCGTPSPGQGAAVLAWTLILALLRSLPAEAASLRGGGWQVEVGGDLKGQTLGVVGLGQLGTIVARVGAAFEMNVLAWSQDLTHEAADSRGARVVSKEELFRRSDIVTLHLRLSERTRGIVGARELAWMKPSAYLVNTARGPLVDESALLEALMNHRIAGAGLDVFDAEPLPTEHPLRMLPNVIATPHIGFVTRETYRAFYGGMVEDVVAWLDGKPVRVLNA